MYSEFWMVLHWFLFACCFFSSIQFKFRCKSDPFMLPLDEKCWRRRWRWKIILMCGLCSMHFCCINLKQSRPKEIERRGRWRGGSETTETIQCGIMKLHRIDGKTRFKFLIKKLFVYFICMSAQNTSYGCIKILNQHKKSDKNHKKLGAVHPWYFFYFSASVISFCFAVMCRKNKVHILLFVFYLLFLRVGRQVAEATRFFFVLLHHRDSASSFRTAQRQRSLFSFVKVLRSNFFLFISTCYLSFYWLCVLSFWNLILEHASMYYYYAAQTIHFL